MLSTVMRRIWLAYVGKTGILTERFARSALELMGVAFGSGSS